MIYHKKYFGLLAMSASVLALGACAVNHPNAMPSGYTYHQQTYKSALPPASPKVNNEQRRYMDAMQAEQFRDGVYDLLERMTARAGMPPKPVYVLAPDPMTTFYANIDNDLREGMRHIGYALSDIPVGAYVFAYDARYLERPRGETISQGQPNVELVLRVFDGISKDARMLSQEIGNYYIQGAETLDIKPAMYRILPTRDRIKQQAEGFTPYEDRRTATQFTTLPALNPAPAIYRASPFTNADRPTPSAPIAPVIAPNMAPPEISSDPFLVPTRAPVATPRPPASYDGPTQAVTIDSSGVSYDYAPPQINTQRLSTNARISPKIDY